MYTEEEIEQMRIKAEKWDVLEAKIAKFYEDENGEVEDEGDLISIGEVAASAFGFIEMGPYWF